MKLRISRWIFLALIVSSFFIMVYGRHVGGPWIMFEVFFISELPNMLGKGNLISCLPIISAFTGQLLFLFLGLRTVKGYRLWLLLLAPLLVTIPVILLLTSISEFQKETIISSIPFLVMVIIFYAESFFKLIKSTKLNTVQND